MNNDSLGEAPKRTKAAAQKCPETPMEKVLGHIDN